MKAVLKFSNENGLNSNSEPKSNVFCLSFVFGFPASVVVVGIREMPLELGVQDRISLNFAWFHLLLLPFLREILSAGDSGCTTVCENMSKLSEFRIQPDFHRNRPWTGFCHQILLWHVMSAGSKVVLPLTFLISSVAAAGLSWWPKFKMTKSWHRSHRKERSRCCRPGFNWVYIDATGISLPRDHHRTFVWSPPW